MKNMLLFALVSLLLVCLSSCSVVSGIFKAGVWTGILAIAGVVILILVLVGRKK